MPVFDFAQDRLEILSDRQPAIACADGLEHLHELGVRVGCMHDVVRFRDTKVMGHH